MQHNGASVGKLIAGVNSSHHRQWRQRSGSGSGGGRRRRLVQQVGCSWSNKENNLHPSYMWLSITCSGLGWRGWPLHFQYLLQILRWRIQRGRRRLQRAEPCAPTLSRPPVTAW